MSLNRPISRLGIFAVLLCSCLVGIGVLAVVQARSQLPVIAQPEYFIAQQSVDPPASSSRMPRNIPVSQPVETLPDAMNLSPQARQSETRWVREERMEYQPDPTTGALVPRPVVTLRPVQGPGADSPNYSLQPAEAEVNQLADQFRQASPTNRDSIMQALTKKLSDIFDARQQEQTARAEKLRAELKETQDLLEKRMQLKAKIVERRAKELTGQQDELSWNPQTSMPHPALSGPNNRGDIYPPSVIPQAYGTSPPPSFLSDRLPLSSNTLPAPGENLPPPDNNQQYGIPNRIDNPAYTRPLEDNTAPQASSNSPTASGTLPYPSALQSSLAPSLDLKPTSQEPSFTTLDSAVPNRVVETSPIPSSSPKDPTSIAESQRSYMSVGFKLKKLILELENKKETLGKDHPSLKASGLPSAIEDTRTAWDFERETLNTELESIESELRIVEQQRELVVEKTRFIQQRASQGTANFNEVKEADVAALNAEREMLQIQFRRRSIQNAIEWMSKFEEKFLKPFDEKPKTID